MYGMDGQLLSSYELLSKLAGQWGTLDTNTKNYIASTIAGTNQLNNFLALMNNFDHAIEATETALNSAGSAARENSRYMEGLEAKTNLLKATFEDLSNNVINSELIKSILDLSNGFLQLLNTPVGTFATQLVLLTGILWGGTGLIQAMKLLPAFINSAAISFNVLGKAITFGAPQLTLIATAIAAIIAISPQLSDWWKTLAGDVEYLTDKIDEANNSLKINKEELDSLYNTPWYDRTPEIQAEIDALEKENDILNRNINYWRDKMSNGDQSVPYTTEGYEITKYGQRSVDTFSGETLQEAAKAAGIVDAASMSVEELQQKLKQLGYTVKETTVEVELSGAQWVQYANETTSALNQVASGEKLNADSLNELGIKTNSLLESMENQVALYKEMSEAGKVLTDDQLAIIDAYEELKKAKDRVVSLDKAQQQLNSTVSLSTDEYYQLIAAYPQLNSMISQTTEGYQLEAGALTDALLAGDQWAWGMIEDQKELTDAAIAETQARLDLLVEEQRMMLATLSLQELLAWSSSAEYKTYASQVEGYMSAIARLEKIRAGQANDKFSSTTDPIEEQSELFKEQLSILEDRLSLLEKSGAPIEEQIALLKEMQDVVHEQAEWYRSQGLDENSKYLRELGQQWWDYYNQIVEIQKEALDDELGLLDDRAWFLEKNLADEKDLNQDSLQDYIKLQNQRVEIFRQAQEKIHALAEAYRAQGLSEDSEQLRELGKLWWEYENDIESVNQSIYDNQERLWEEQMQAQIDAIQSQIDVYEKLFSYVSNQIDKEIEKLQEQRDIEEDYWDAKIQALEDQNDEIERQIQLEDLQKNRAAAEQQQMLVYKDGRFQYVQNVQAISEAETELEAFEREEALRQEVENLEKLKEQALASIDEQIAGWEQYKEQWSSVVEHYQEEQDRLLLEQELGIELEGENWRTRLDNLAEYVAEYEELMARLTSAQNQLNAGYQGGSGGGGSSGGSGWSSGPSYGSSGGAMRNPNRPSYDDDDKPSSGTGSAGVGISGGWSSGGGLIGYPSKPSQDISDSAWKDYVDSGGKYASGTLSASGGISLVGENGPELRVLNQGDGIIPSSATKNLMELSKYSIKDILATKGQNVYSYMFDKLVLPNVTDAQSFINELKRFKQYVYQH